MEPFHIDALGRWSYLFVVSQYYVVLFALLFYFKVTFKFERWKLFFVISVNTLLILGFAFEWIAGIFKVWGFDASRYFLSIPIPIYGWFTGHRIPIEEAMWIIAVVPLFYYFYQWNTFMFHDIIFVTDEKGKFYKKEERWVGLFGETRILVRPKGMKDRKYETVVKLRKPGFIAKLFWRLIYANKAN